MLGEQSCQIRRIAENLREAGPIANRDIVRPLSDPLYKTGPMVILRGNLAAEGAVAKLHCGSVTGLQPVGPHVVGHQAECRIALRGWVHLGWLGFGFAVFLPPRTR